MASRILYFFKEELHGTKIQFKNTRWKLKLFSHSIFIYFLIIFSVGIVVMSKSWPLFFVWLPFILDLVLYLVWGTGYLAYVEREKRKVLKANLEEGIGHFICDIKTAKSRFKKSQLKKFLNEESKKKSYKSSIESLEKKINWDYRIAVLIRFGIAVSIAAVVNKELELLIATDGVLVEFKTLFVLTKLTIVLVTISPFVYINYYIGHKFGPIREVIKLLQELEDEK